MMKEKFIDDKLKSYDKSIDKGGNKEKIHINGD
jgi:hypothetical protein